MIPRLQGATLVPNMFSPAVFINITSTVSVWILTTERSLTEVQQPLQLWCL